MRVRIEGTLGFPFGFVRETGRAQAGHAIPQSGSGTLGSDYFLKVGAGTAGDECSLRAGPAVSQAHLILSKISWELE